MVALTQLRAEPAEATFMELYDREAHTVLRYLRTAAPGAEAEDLAAETFSRAWRAWSRFRGTPVEARAWLLRIARNAAIDAGRRRGGVRLVPIDDHHPADRQGPDAEAVDRILLRNALAQLNREDRHLLALRAAGLSHAEIGALVGKSEAAAKMAWHRAAERLRPHLERAS